MDRTTRRTAPDLTPDLWWLFDCYVLLLNAKLRKIAQPESPPASIMGAILAQFLIDNQHGILEEFKYETSQKAISTIDQLVSDGTSRTIAEKKDGTVRDDAGKQRKPVATGESKSPASLRYARYRTAERFTRGSKEGKRLVP